MAFRLRDLDVEARHRHLCSACDFVSASGFPVDIATVTLVLDGLQSSRNSAEMLTRWRGSECTGQLFINSGLWVPQACASMAHELMHHALRVHKLDYRTHGSPLTRAHEEMLCDLMGYRHVSAVFPDHIPLAQLQCVKDHIRAAGGKMAVMQKLGDLQLRWSNSDARLRVLDALKDIVMQLK
jgi:hypothetical protein